MLVVHVVDVTGPLPIDLVDRPHRLGVALARVGLADLVTEFVLEGREYRRQVVEALSYKCNAERVGAGVAMARGPSAGGRGES